MASPGWRHWLPSSVGDCFALTKASCHGSEFMEVRVEAIQGELPEGCCISVRFGGVQKQALYDSSKVYRFPEARRFGKVELYQLIGTCDVTWGNDQPETIECAPGGNNPAVEGVALKISLAPSTAPKSGTVGKDAVLESEKNVSVRQQTLKYLQQHNVESMLTGAMCALLKAMPHDPSNFLCDYITSHSGSVRSGPPSASPAAKLEPAYPSTAQSTKSVPPVLPPLRSGAGGTVETPTLAGGAAAAPASDAVGEKGAEAYMSSARQMAFDMLLQATGTGDLEEALESAMHLVSQDSAPSPVKAGSTTPAP